ncbi:MAG: metallophosphoesterase family protein [Dehalococcoidia bacterium]
MRIGLISDTHIPEAGDDLWPQVYDAFRGVDLILPAGDLHVPQVLDWLERLAPAAVWGNGDYLGWERTQPPTDPRLREARVVPIDGLRIGLVHDFPLEESPPLRTFEGLIKHYFGGPVDVIVRGNTHRAEIITHKDVLLVNPGSPTFPNHMQLQLGTVGFLETDGGRAHPSIQQLR